MNLQEPDITLSNIGADNPGSPDYDSSKEDAYSNLVAGLSDRLFDHVFDLLDEIGMDAKDRKAICHAMTEKFCDEMDDVSNWEDYV